VAEGALLHRHSAAEPAGDGNLSEKEIEVRSVRRSY